jgi:antirestriction protein ArdC
MKTQINKFTKMEYRGKNQTILQEVKERENYKSNQWITFCQARMLDLRLVNAKGKGVKIIMVGNKKETKEKKNEKRKNQELGEVTGSFGYATVFNCDLVKKVK